MRNRLVASLAAALCLAGGAAVVGAQDKEALDAVVAQTPFKNVKYFDLRDESITRISFLSDALYAETASNKVYAIDRETGVVRWVFETDTKAPLDYPPVIAHGVPEERAQLEEDLVKVRVRLEDEKRAKNRDMVKLRQLLVRSREIQETHRVLLERDNVYCLSKGWLFCLDRMGGQVYWSKDLSRLPLPIVASAPIEACRSNIFIADIKLDRVYPIEVGRRDAFRQLQAGGQIVGRPVFEDPSVYFTSMDGYAYCFHTTGDQIWKHKTLGPIKAGPAIGLRRWSEGEGKQKHDVVEKTCYVGSTDMALYAFDADGGNLRWKYETGAVIETPAVAVGDTVYVKTEHGALLALNVKPLHKNEKGEVIGERRDGELRWRIPLGERFVVKTDSRVYVLGQDAQLFGVEEMSGAIKSRHDLSAFPFILTNTIDGTLYLVHPNGHFYVCKESKTEF